MFSLLGVSVLPRRTAGKARHDRPAIPIVTYRPRIFPPAGNGPRLRASADDVTAQEGTPMAQSHLYAGVAGYFGRQGQEGLVGVFRREVAGGDWQHAVKEVEAHTVM